MSEEGQSALAELRAHVQVCDVRYQNIETAMERIGAGVEQLRGWFIGTGCALILGLFAIIAYFISKHGV
jgi:hypothetical protein